MVADKPELIEADAEADAADVVDDINEKVIDAMKLIWFITNGTPTVKGGMTVADVPIVCPSVDVAAPSSWRGS
jgi:hypothetical protein